MKQIHDATGQVTAATSTFDPTSFIQEALGQVVSLNTSSVNMTGNIPITSYMNNFQNVVDSFPPVAMDRTDTNNQNKLKTQYFSSASANFWIWYETNVTSINTILSTATQTPAGFRNNYDLNSVWNLTTATVNAAGASWGGGTTDSDLLAQLAYTDPLTDIVNAAVSANDVVVTNFTIISDSLNNIGQYVNELTDVSDQVFGSSALINTTLYGVLSTANNILDGVDVQVDNVDGLGDFVSTAPDYTKCGFVGEFYHDGFKNGFCKDFNGSLVMVWPFMLGAAFCLLVSFLTFACHVRKPGWYLDDEEMLTDGTNILSPGVRPAVVLA